MPDIAANRHVPRKRKRRGLIPICRSLKQPFIQTLLVFLFSFARLFSIPSPFAVTLSCAFGMMGESPLFSMIGSGAALGLMFLWGVQPDPWQLAGCVLLAFGRRFYYQKAEGKGARWTALALTPRLVYALIFQSPLHQLMALASLCMGSLCLPLFTQTLRLWRQPKESWGWDDRLCLSLTAGLLFCALGYFRIWEVNLGILAACLLTLCLAGTCGSGTGSATGLLCGTALALCGLGSTPILILCAGGMSAGLLTVLDSRWKTALTFALTIGLISLIDQSAQFAGQCTAALLAGIFYILAPSVQLERLKGIAAQLKPRGKPHENSYAGEMLRQWESAIDEMAQSLPALPSIDDEITWAHLRDALCAGCEKWQACWETDSPARMFLSSFCQSESREERTLEGLAEELSFSCCRIHLLRPAAVQAAAALENAKTRLCRATLEQEMIKTHLSAMAQAVRRLSAAAQGDSLEDLKGYMEIERVLRESSFPAHILYVRRNGGHLQCLLESDTPAFTRWQPQRLLSDLWAHGGLSMEITRLERSRMLLEETPVFRLETGSATLALEEDNGDGILSMRLSGSRHLLALSDGMGHGPNAHQESRETLNLLRLCLAADYTRAQAITAVNGMMLSATGGDRFATVDLWTIDLWNGLAQVEKLGACQSCLWRGDQARLIEGAALPLGILEKVSAQSRQIRLHDNDLLLIFSDGVQDAFPDEESLVAAIGRSVYQDPQRTADALLRQALIARSGVPADDMTVLAARLTQWSAPASPISYAES